MNDIDNTTDTRLSEKKKALRREIRSRKQAMTAEELAAMSAVITKKLLQHPRITQAATIMLYCSLPDEPDTHSLIKKLSEKGKRIVLPVVTGPETMELREYSSTADMRKGAFGILEPTGTPFTGYDSIDTAIVPGMSFDDSGHRLGRGKGYYDRFLPKMKKAYTIGVCFDFQKEKAVPAGELDFTVDEVI